MAEDSVVESPNVLREKHSTVRREWRSYTITAPGSEVMSPVSTTMGAAGGIACAILASILLGTTFRSGWAMLAVPIGPFLGVAYAKFINRTVGTESLVRKGKAVTLLECDRNKLVVQAAKRDAPAYFQAAQRASELDAVEKRLDVPGLSSAEQAVLHQELSEGTAELNLILSQASLVYASALLNPSDPAIRAAGHLTAAMYAELQEGKAASYDEDH